MAYKGFDKDLRCRDFQFETGKSYSMGGEIKACERGFHACANPFDLWNYYPPLGGTRFAKVEQLGQIATHNGDSKVASSEIKIGDELSLLDFIRHGVEWIKSNAATTGYRANAATTGDGANAVTTGEWANAATTGNRANAATTGYRALASVNGLNSIAASIGHNGMARAGRSGFIILVAYDDNGAPLGVFHSAVGQNGIEAGVTYRLNSAGIVEVVSRDPEYLP
jgi:hypothetical protein